MRAESFIAGQRRGEGRLWLIALGGSLALDFGLLLVFGLISGNSKFAISQPQPVVSGKVAEEKVLKIFPAMLKQVAAEAAVKPPPSAATNKPRFARTSADQATSRPEKPAFMGEHNTQAQGDRPATPNAPEMPSQAGAPPKSATDFETQDRRYQDGKIAEESVKTTRPVETTPLPPVLMPSTPLADPAKASKLTASKPLPQSTGTVDIPVAEKLPEPAAKPPEKPPAPTPPVNDPAFRGHQRKTAIVGSISRDGRNALAVADSPLGRYQALISRAVELEWQRNCVRHRDFITPGFLTVRFSVEASGQVRTVQFVGEMETGEVQKGFTLNAIRDAQIPAMPAPLKKDYVKEPLELIFNFYF